MSVSAKTRFQILRRDHFKCVYCGASPATNQRVELEVDHVVPRAEGGPDLVENLVASCRECNRGKSARPSHVVGTVPPAVAVARVEMCVQLWRAVHGKEASSSLQRFLYVLNVEFDDLAIDRIVAYRDAFWGSRALFERGFVAFIGEELRDDEPEIFKKYATEFWPEPKQ